MAQCSSSSIARPQSSTISPILLCETTSATHSVLSLPSDSPSAALCIELCASPFCAFGFKGWCYLRFHKIRSSARKRRQTGGSVRRHGVGRDRIKNVWDQSPARGGQRTRRRYGDQSHRTD